MSGKAILQSYGAVLLPLSKLGDAPIGKLSVQFWHI
jgi:hypothetical protein